MKLSQEKIDKVYKITQWITVSILVGGFILLVLLPIGKSKWSWGIWFGLFLVSGILANVVKHWATDEEAEEFKKAVKDAVQEAAKETGDIQIIVLQMVFPMNRKQSSNSYCTICHLIINTEIASA